MTASPIATQTQLRSQLRSGDLASEILRTNHPFVKLVDRVGVQGCAKSGGERLSWWARNPKRPDIDRQLRCCRNYCSTEIPKGQIFSSATWLSETRSVGVMSRPDISTSPTASHSSQYADRSRPIWESRVTALDEWGSAECWIELIGRNQNILDLQLRSCRIILLSNRISAGPRDGKGCQAKIRSRVVGCDSQPHIQPYKLH
jgi:hypothetical protein